MEIAKTALLLLAVLCAAAAFLYECAAWICPEFFTLGYEYTFGDLPFWLLAPLRGVLDFLPPGAITGVALGLAGNFGPRPQLLTGFFRRPMIALAVFVAFSTVAAGIIGYWANRNGAFDLTGPLRPLLAEEKHPRAVAIHWALLGGQVGHGLAALAITGWAWQQRGRFDRMLRERRGE